ncbi:nucleoside triphosphate pyrophosphohydrolase [Pseudoflavonifractor sp. 524-17]|uniref:nucleoside triphosphate pyrophosphohydrolase n=1 Tax=Pseudoflavonifractor sp. 524-17 TaxID=2304577 RepID=UPI0013795EAB|nr:nucleoside triphosphate pyrophosphohydrolase [Pseudoflavonifractor sp. 524-17]NCE63496.1 nucleoside triphosphate pyrophosphohydrolase [Pseudoflavonifractor sp. 524-17]
MIDFVYKPNYGVKDLEEIVRLLRSPGGCPWDAEQTHESIRRNFLEEAYEAVEAIDEGSPDHLREELGDVLLQIVLHARMEEEAGRFDLDGVADGICKKLIYRHPHVFGDVNVSDTGEVLSNWEALKRREKGQATHTDALSAVARSLPALWRAEKVQKKARKAGFDWDGVSGALDKLSEELQELRQAVDQDTNVEEELGDLLFCAVNVSRFVKADPEEVLTQATDKFIRRFREVERLAAETGTPMEEMSLAQLDELWERAKKT